ncbi:MAG TPA: hypothetical protein VD973_13445 [Symbiobacteriaceae bacterium]|nr:hypothetical protein [Symbiobacteriaceae bacterium]
MTAATADVVYEVRPIIMLVTMSAAAGPVLVGRWLTCSAFCSGST